MKKIVSSLICVLVAQGLCSAQVSRALDQESFKEMYGNLKVLQILPPQKEKDAEGCHKIWDNIKQDLTSIAVKATATGFKNQYKEILTTPTNPYRDTITKLISPAVLRWIAFNENKFGHQGKFTYDKTREGKPTYKNFSKVDNDAFVYEGKYLPPTGSARETRVISIYSIIHGLIEQFDEVNNLRLTPEQTTVFVRWTESLRENIQQAIDLTTQEINERQATEKRAQGLKNQVEQLLSDKNTVLDQKFMNELEDLLKKFLNT